MKSLESRRFVATPADIAALTQGIVAGSRQSVSGQGTYLRALVATLQHELEAPVRLRAGKGAKLTPEITGAHLQALEAVHERFYNIVVATARKASDSPSDLNKSTNFARTAKSKLRGWIRAGGDVRALAAARVTHAALVVDRPSAPPTAKRLLSAAQRARERLTEATAALAKQDASGATTFLETVLANLVSTLSQMGAVPTKDAAQAMREHRPFKSPAGVFYPAPRTTEADREIRLAA